MEMQFSWKRGEALVKRGSTCCGTNVEVVKSNSDTEVQEDEEHEDSNEHEAGDKSNVRLVGSLSAEEIMKKVGKSHEEAYEFYRLCARCNGFGICKGDSGIISYIHGETTTLIHIFVGLRDVHALEPT
ncbi:hypothetical protein PIB30_091424 [Stylosanthes scabra]|uniref:Uncharacterized protein n=1 Tax=Stylosanthes scabra TaxID=79078 RepID=A0ABU6RUG9_9FABA|nr:hypothetical protein [Stylosanthes scabra]